MNLAENLIRTAAARGDQIAVKLDDLQLSYAVLDQATSGSQGCCASVA